MAAEAKTTKGGKGTQTIEQTLEAIRKDYGPGSVMYLRDGALPEIRRTSTGSLAIDAAVGGGIPVGRVVEIYGPESSGKTTLTLHCIANAQQGGTLCAFVDAEHALDPEYARKLGVDTDALLLSQPDSGEQALGIVEKLADSGHVGLIVVDSVAALVPQAELNGEMGDSHVGLQARLMSQALRKLTGISSKHDCTIIFINQLREKIGVMFGSPETTTGGKALKFYASLRLDVRRIETLKEGGEPVGNRTRVKVVKNKTAPPFKQAEFDIKYGTGIDVYSELVDLAVECKAIQKSGSWFTREGVQLGQGKANAAAALADDGVLRAEVEAEVKAHLAPPKAPADAAGANAAGAAPTPPDPTPAAVADTETAGATAPAAVAAQ